MNFPPVHGPDAILFGGLSYSSVGTMGPSNRGTHVKHIEFRFPRFHVTPQVSLQIIGGQSATPIAVYSLKMNDNVDGQTQIAVEAQTLGNDSNGKPVPAQGTYHCNIVVLVPGDK